MRLRTTSRVPLLRTSFTAGTAIAAMLIVALAAAPASANIAPGSDVWVTSAGSSYQDFSPTPIPPGFFGPGSQPFSGIVILQGDPLGGPFGFADTIVERPAPAFPICGVPASEITIPIEIVALSLTSVSPITVTYDVGPPLLWNVDVTLSSIVIPQPPGTMTIRKTHPNGGTFTSTLYVQPKFIFTQVTNPLNTRILDTGGLTPPIEFSSDGHWLEPAAAPDFFFQTIPAPTPLDHDNNPGTPDRIIQPTTPNFVAGMRGVGGSCGNPIEGAGKALTEEEAQWAAHGVYPAQEQKPIQGEGATCLLDATCIVTTPLIANRLRGQYRGNQTLCGGDADNNGRDDLCAVNFIPGLAPWGAAALAILLVGSGLWFIARRREGASPAM